jgi:hypothetical protein
MSKSLTLALTALALVGCNGKVSGSDMQLATSLCAPHSGVKQVSQPASGGPWVECNNGLFINAVNLTTKDK